MTGNESYSCYHCSLPVIRPGEFNDTAKGTVRQFCCAGCQAIAGVIEHSGFSRYYEFRDQPGSRPDLQSNDIFDVYDKPTMQVGWVTQGPSMSAEILVEGIHCAACVWLIENWLKQLPGVESAYVNLSQFRLSIEWSADQLNVSDIFRQLKKIGYGARPFSQSTKQAQLNKQRHALLKQLGIAAVFGMQVMVISVALYSGDWFGIDPAIRTFLERVNLLLILPVLFYSAQPFFTGAIRNLKLRTAGMDLPVSLGLILAFLGSVWASLSHTGDIYYDSIAMFVFFLLGARYLELVARMKGSTAMDMLSSATPEYATRYSTDKQSERFVTVPVAELNIDDRILVKPGEVLPADGILLDQCSTFDESLLSGEHAPILRSVGDQVLSGSINIDQAVFIRVNKQPENTTLSSILRMAQASNQDKPRIAMLSEIVASRFVVVILFLAGIVAVGGIIVGSDTWLTTTIAVLVVTCPCALSLATPLAITASINTMMQKGVFIAKQHALETLTKVNHVVFDKTGTLTSDTPKLINIETMHEINADECLCIAASLEQYSAHPIARSLLGANNLELLSSESYWNIPGLGVSGVINQQTYYLGSDEYIAAQLKQPLAIFQTNVLHSNPGSNNSSIVFLANNKTLLAAFTLQESLRNGVKPLINYLGRHNIALSLYSGDRQQTVNDLALKLGIKDAHGGCKPDQKLKYVKDHISSGKTVAMIGDGINDSPALSQAHLAIACTGNINLSAANADIVLTNKSIDSLQFAHRFAHKTSRIIRQNISWAIIYNLCAVPAAVMGWVPPWLAGIGMSLSSVIVVINASRLNRVDDLPTEEV
ncbi:MAG: Cu2+-exporting ATPase [Parasphingorhabdus sp.]|jgi:Cu2+-exporting ATPase